MNTPTISHSREQETPEAKARWFKSLSVEERMDYLCFLTDLVLQNKGKALKAKHAEPIAGRVRVLSTP